MNESISNDRLRNTRAWAAARPDMSGSSVIVGAIDELLQRRAVAEPVASKEQLAEIKQRDATMSPYCWMAPYDRRVLLQEVERLQRELEWVKAVNAELFPYQERAIKAEQSLRTAHEPRDGRVHPDTHLIDILDMRHTLQEMLRLQELRTGQTKSAAMGEAQ